MSSKANKNQILTIALYEALLVMAYKQTNAIECDEIYQQAIDACNKAYPVLRDQDANGGLIEKDVLRYKILLDNFREKYFAETTIETALSLCICMITDKLTMIKNDQKRKVFEAVLHSAENLLWHIDPTGESADVDGFKAACILEDLVNG